MNRRALIQAAPFFLAACTTTGGTSVNVSQAIVDAGIVVTGVSNVYQSFVVLYPRSLSATHQATITADLVAARAALASLSASASNITNLAGLQSVETAINEVLSILTTVLPSVPNVPSQITTGVMAANVLLPIIEIVINQLQGAPSKPASAAQPAMSPESARATLAK